MINDNTGAPLAAYRRSISNNIILTWVVVALSVVIVLLALGYMVLLPLKEKELQIVEFKTGENNFVTVAKAGENLRSNTLLLSMMLRRFVKDRETIDKITEKDRYARVFAMSSSDEADSFKKVYGSKKSLYYKEHFKRDIAIRRDASLGPGIYQVEFTTIDTYDDKPGDTRHEWVATINYVFKRRSVSFDQARFNPLGIIIAEYSLSRRQE